MTQKMSEWAQEAVMNYRGHPRRFLLVRKHDKNGMSGVGIIGEGTAWTDGTASLRWLGEHPKIDFWDKGWEDMAYIHTHGGDGHTEVVFLEELPVDLGHLHHLLEKFKKL